MANDNPLFVRLKGRVIGPYTESELIALRDRGQFKPFHEISSDKVTWVSAGTLTNIFQSPSRLSMQAAIQQFVPSQSGKNQPIDPDIKTSESNWYYISLENQQIGPVNEKTITELIEKRSISSETLVWQDGMPDWIPASQPFANHFSAPPQPLSKPEIGFPTDSIRNANQNRQDPAIVSTRLLANANIANLLLALFPPISSAFILTAAIHTLKVNGFPKVYSFAAIASSIVSAMSYAIFMIGGSVNFNQTRAILSSAWEGSLFSDPPTVNMLWLGGTLVLAILVVGSNLAATTAATFLGSRLAWCLFSSSDSRTESFKNLASCQLAISIALMMVFTVCIGLPAMLLFGVNLLKPSVMPRALGIASLTGLILIAISGCLRLVESSMLKKLRC